MAKQALTARIRIRRRLGRCTERCALAAFAVLAALLLAAAAPAAEVVQIRVGNHPTFTRVVFELDAASGYRIERHAAGEDPNTILVTLDAGSRARSIRSQTPGVASVDVAAAPSQAVARIVTRKAGLPMKEMILANPPRIVLDLMLPETDRVGSAPAKAPRTAASPKPAPPAPEAKAPPAPTAAKASTPAPSPKSTVPEPAVQVAQPKPPVPEPAVQVAKPKPPVSEPVAQPKPVVPAEPSSAKSAPAPKAAKPAAEPMPVTAAEAAPPPAPVVVEKPFEPSPAVVAEPPSEVAAVGDEADADAGAPDAAPTETPDETPEIADGHARADAVDDSEAMPVPEIVTEVVAEEPEPAAIPTPSASEGSPLDELLPGVLAGGALAVLLVIFMIVRGRRRRAEAGMDVLAMAEAGGAPDERMPADGFSMAMSDEDLPPETFRPATDARVGDPSPLFDDTTDGPGAGPGIFDEDPEEKEAMTMDNQDLPITHADPEAQTQFAGAARAKKTGAAPSDSSRSLQEFERRLAHLEARLNESIEARERLERQVTAQNEELRVQRAAIARTQRALRSLSRTDDDQATEPALRETVRPNGDA